MDFGWNRILGEIDDIIVGIIVGIALGKNVGDWVGGNDGTIDGEILRFVGLGDGKLDGIF